MIGFSLNSLREAFYGEHADRLLLIEYKALCCDPGRIIRSIYKWLGLEPFAHDYENVETPPHVAEFDARLGTPGLHAVARKIRLLESKRIIPPDLWNSFETPFWRQSNPQEVPVIMYDVEKQNGKTPPRGSGHHAEAAAMLLS
jgi:sulfotransferase